MHLGPELHPLGAHLPDATVDQLFAEFEIGDAVAHQSANAVTLLEQGDGVPGTGQLLCAGQPRGAGAYDGNPLAAFVWRHLRYDPPLFPGAIDNGAFDGFDGDRVVINVQGAGRLAGRGADAAGKFREVVGGVQHLDGLPPLALVDQIIPIGDDVIDRAAVVAKGDTAIHAAGSLLSDRLGAERDNKFIVVGYPVCGRCIAPILTRELQKACGFAH